jgi:hypothetical protein
MRSRNVCALADTAIPSSLHRIPFRIAKLSLTGPFSTGVGDHLGSSWCCIYFSLFFFLSIFASLLYPFSACGPLQMAGQHTQWLAVRFISCILLLDGHGDQQPSYTCTSSIRKANFSLVGFISLSLSNFSTQNRTRKKGKMTTTS